MNTAYVYKWTHTPSFRWYIGSRTSKNANPNDGYICSSKTVKPMIKSKPEEWVREIIFIGSPQQAYDFETMCLQTLNASGDPRSFNMHNNDKFIKSNIGKPCSKRTRSKISNSNKGKPKSAAHKKALSLAKKKTGTKPPSRSGCSPWNKGIPRSDEHKQKQSESMKGTIPYNKGTTQPIILCPHCGKDGGESVMKRWHFDNCKLKGRL